MFRYVFGPFESPKLTYWLRESKFVNAEADYVIASGRQIIPVEVKAGKSGTLNSLQQFALSNRSGLAVRFDLNLPGIGKITHAAQTRRGSQTVSFPLLSLPLYMVDELFRIVSDKAH